MTSLVEELQRAALDEDKDTSALLRIAMTVARKLGLSEIDEFLKYELHGYPEDADVPPYRVVRGAWLARNAYREVPVVAENTEDRDAAELRSVRYSVSELERLAMGKEKLVYPMPHQLMPDRTYSYVAISKSDLHGILDKVRTAVLEWALTLEEKGISGEGFSFKKEERDRANQTPSVMSISFDRAQQVNVQHGTVGSHQTATVVMSDKLEELAALLRDALPTLELSEDDRAEVGRAIQAIEAEAKKPDAEQETGPLRTTLGRVTNILVGADAARELVQAFVEALASL